MVNIKQSNSILITLLIMLFLIAFNFSVNAKENKSACYKNCVNQYGNVLGKTKSGVTAYSNCNNDCVIFEPGNYLGTYTGLKWQCVEFARRWLLINHGVVYGDVDYAIDIWNEINHYTHIKSKTDIKVESFVNGSSSQPAKGDLLIYAKALLGTGHVAVITHVDKEKQKLYIGEQNYKNKKWDANFSRVVDYVHINGRYWVHDEYLVGWKHAGFI